MKNLKEIIKLAEKFEKILKLADFQEEISQISEDVTNSVNSLEHENFEDTHEGKYKEDVIYPPSSKKDSVALKDNEVKPFLQQKSKENLEKLKDKPVGSFMVVNFNGEQYKTVITIHTWTTNSKGKKINYNGPGIHLEKII